MAVDEADPLATRPNAAGNRRNDVDCVRADECDVADGRATHPSANEAPFEEHVARLRRHPNVDVDSSVASLVPMPKIINKKKKENKKQNQIKNRNEKKRGKTSWMSR